MLPSKLSPDDHVGCCCHSPELLSVSRRIDASLSRRGLVAGMAAAISSLGLPNPTGAKAAAENPSRPILFTNVRLLDGKSSTLREAVHVLVDGNRIKRVAEGNPPAPDDVQLIDGGGRVLMPGLIDAHWHSIFAALPLPTLMSADIGYIYLAASAEAERTLMRGFTTVRDLGGPAFVLKEAIDRGLVAGPRIFPSGAMITATGGHGDLRPLTDVPNFGGSLTRVEQTGGSIIADGPNAVRLRVREQLLHGASQIKLVGSGGVSSPRSPLEAFTYTEPELRAGVEAAADWGTYATVHAYPSGPIQRAIAAGAKCIEHGHLMDEATAKLMADKGVWLSIQPFVGDDDSICLTGQSRIDQLQVIAGHGSRLSARQKSRDQDGVRLRLAVLRRVDGASGRHADASRPLVHNGRSPEYGDGRQWRAARLVRPAQSLRRKAGCRRRRCLCRSAAGRRQSPR